MTSHHEPSRDRHHQARPIDTEVERYTSCRKHGIIADQDPRLTSPEQELFRQLGAKLFGWRQEGGQ